MSRFFITLVFLVTLTGCFTEKSLQVVVREVSEDRETVVVSCIDNKQLPFTLTGYSMKKLFAGMSPGDTTVVTISSGGGYDLRRAVEFCKAYEAPLEEKEYEELLRLRELHSSFKKLSERVEELESILGVQKN